MKNWCRDGDDERRMSREVNTFHLTIPPTQKLVCERGDGDTRRQTQSIWFLPSAASHPTKINRQFLLSLNSRLSTNVEIVRIQSIRSTFNCIIFYRQFSVAIASRWIISTLFQSFGSLLPSSRVHFSATQLKFFIFLPLSAGSFFHSFCCHFVKRKIVFESLESWVAFSCSLLLIQTSTELNFSHRLTGNGGINDILSIRIEKMSFVRRRENKRRARITSFSGVECKFLIKISFCCRSTEWQKLGRNIDSGEHVSLERREKAQCVAVCV